MLDDVLRMEEFENLLKYYKMYKTAGYKINVYKNKFSKVYIDVDNNELDLYISKDLYKYFKEVIKYE